MRRLPARRVPGRPFAGGRLCGLTPRHGRRPHPPRRSRPCRPSCAPPRRRPRPRAATDRAAPAPRRGPAASGSARPRPVGLRPFWPRPAPPREARGSSFAAGPEREASVARPCGYRDVRFRSGAVLRGALLAGAVVSAGRSAGWRGAPGFCGL